MAIMTDFDFICAKIRGMRSKLYEHERLRRLTGKENLQQLFEEVSPQMSFKNHLQFEQNLVAGHIRVLDEILKFTRGANFAFFEWLLRRYQVENIKVVLRCWISRENMQAVASHIVPMPEIYALPLQEMFACNDILTFLSLIPERRLAEGARKGIFYFSEKEKGFFIEAGLDCAYYTTLAEYLSLLGRTHRAGCENLISGEITLYNLMFVLRSKLHYDLPWETIRDFIIRRASALSFETLYSIYTPGNLSDMVSSVPKSVLRETDFHPRDVLDVEKRLWADMYRKANRQFYHSLFDMGSLIAFYYIKRIELLNLIKITEALRYGLGAADTEKTLIRLSN